MTSENMITAMREKAETALLRQIERADWAKPVPPFKLFSHEGVAYIEIDGDEFSLGDEGYAAFIMAEYIGVIDELFPASGSTGETAVDQQARYKWEAYDANFRLMQENERLCGALREIARGGIWGLTDREAFANIRKRAASALGGARGGRNE